MQLYNCTDQMYFTAIDFMLYTIKIICSKPVNINQRLRTADPAGVKAEHSRPPQRSNECACLGHARGNGMHYFHRKKQVPKWRQIKILRYVFHLVGIRRKQNS